MTDDEDNLCVRSHEVPIPPIAVSATGARIAFANRLLVIGMGHPHAAPQKIQSSLVKRYPLHAGKKYHVLSTLLRRLRTYEVYVLQKVGKRSARYYWTKKSPLRTSLSRTFSAVLSHNTRRTIADDGAVVPPVNVFQPDLKAFMARSKHESRKAQLGSFGQLYVR